jgi:hypothetical protein
MHLKVTRGRAETPAMRLRKHRKDAGQAEPPSSPISDVGSGMYGPDDTKDRPVSRFERSRVPKKRSDAQHKA